MRSGSSGEPGIGKSRLLGELGGRAEDRGHVVVAGRAAELERDVPFAVWSDALDGHLGERGAEVLEGLAADEVADLALALPAVARMAEVAPAVAVERHRVARAVRLLLARLAAARPLTLLLDDVHWADPASADVIALLLHRPPDGAVLLALAARTGRAPALEARLETAARHRAGEMVEVGPLSRDAADALMPGVGSTAQARLYAESGGNPFYLEELARAGPAAPGGARPAGAPGVPRAVMAALADEIAGLGEEARLIAQAGAVAGDPFDPAIAGAVAGVDEAVALAAVDSLLAVDLVRLDGAPAALSLSPSARPPCGVRVRRRRLAARCARARGGGAGGAWRDAGGARAPRRARGTRRRSRRGGTARARRRADGAVGAGHRRGLVRGGVAAAAERGRARPAAAASCCSHGPRPWAPPGVRSRRATRCAACSRCCRPMPRTGARAWP